MKDLGDGGVPVPISRVDLRRATVLELCRSDELIRGCALLLTLAEGEAERLLSGAVARRFPAGSAVYREGDEGQAMFLVLRGEVRLSSGGGSVVFAVASKGDLFGEAELVTSRGARGSSAVAAGDADVVELPAALLKEVGRGNPRLVELVQRLHSSRRAATRELAEFLDRW